MGVSPWRRVLAKLNHHRTTEAYFIGYPKTGNTWMRFMLGRYIQQICHLPYQPLFDATDWLGRCESFCVGPAIQFTHRPLRWEDQAGADLTWDNVVRPFTGKKVVLIVRHPLDTLVSLWCQQRLRTQHGFQGELESFLADPVFGLEKCFRFHRLWRDQREREEGLYLLRYEDLRARPEESFGTVMNYLEIPLREQDVRQAIEAGDFDNMKKIESSGSGPKYRSSGLDIFATGDRSNPDAYHVRRGKVGGYRDYLDEGLVAELEQRVENEMGEWYGYRVTGESA